ncbi:MAG: metal ABC transporter permease [Cyclobacteriaceae bacterium]|nr:metal ABC transporter permease [Cyclobacteriaceae bacterium]
MDAFFVILTGSLVAVTCGILGIFLMLRRMVMIGDAISHSVLPGIVIAFLISGSRDGLAMLIAAVITGLLTTFIIQFIHEKGKLQADASIGVTFTWLFAIGIILISVFADYVDLDQECVLYGEIAYVPIDLWILPSGIIMGPRSVYMLGTVLLIVVITILFFFKEFYMVTFDQDFAVSTGLSVTLWHYILMALISLTTVASFESVGAILVVAFLVAPPASAYLLSDDFKTIIILTVFIGIIVAISGYFLAVYINSSISGSMTVMAGIIFAIAWLLAFRRRNFQKSLKIIKF